MEGYIADMCHKLCKLLMEVLMGYLASVLSDILTDSTEALRQLKSLTRAAV